MNRHSASLAIREIQIEATIKCHYIPIRMARKIMTTSNAGENNTEKPDHSYIARGTIKWYSHSGKHGNTTELSSTQIVNREFFPLQDLKTEININQINRTKSMKAHTVMELLDGQNRITSKSM